MMSSPGADVQKDSLQKEMIKASKKGDAARAAELLSQDRSLLQASESDGTTPLHYAAWKGHRELAALLLENGADVHALKDSGHWGGTPLHAAAHANSRAVAELLIAHGADVRAVSGNSRTPLEETKIHNASAVAKLLIQHGAGA
ncbi:MAG: ankyrin repeat domain-containing protein [Chloroflexi bacterium]|nr:ankyrin repeat domain-containing protein [Chloroflexota bacterium]